MARSFFKGAPIFSNFIFAVISHVWDQARPALGDDMAHELRLAHTAMEDDAIFAAATGEARPAPPLRDKIEIGAVAADCLARAIARAVYEATPLPFPGALPSWRERHGELKL